MQLILFILYFYFIYLMINVVLWDITYRLF